MDGSLSPRMSMPVDISQDGITQRSRSSFLNTALLRSQDSLHRPPTPLDSCGDEISSFRKHSVLGRRASRFASSTEGPPAGLYDGLGGSTSHNHDVLHSPLVSRTSCSPGRLRSRLAGHSHNGGLTPTGLTLSTSPPSLNLLQGPSSPHAMASPFGAEPVTPRGKSVTPSRTSTVGCLTISPAGSLSMIDALDQLHVEAKPQAVAGRTVVSGPLVGADRSGQFSGCNGVSGAAALPMQHDSLSSWARTQQLGFKRKGSSGF